MAESTIINAGVCLGDRPRLVARPSERAAVCVGADVCSKTCVVATWSSPDYLVFINH